MGALCGPVVQAPGGGGGTHKGEEGEALQAAANKPFFVVGTCRLTHLRVSASQVLHQVCISFIHWRARGWRGWRGPWVPPEAASRAA